MMDVKRREFLKNLAALSALSLSAPLARAQAPRYDVVVVGAGIAGLAAAVAAREAGAKRVAVLEKGPMIGGHAAYADGSLCAVVPEMQRPLGIEDSPEKMARQIWEWGEKRGDPALVRILAERSGDAVRWLMGMGVQFMPRVYIAYPGNFRRAITSHPDRGGYEYIWALNRRARSLGVEILLNTRAFSLDSKGSRITGVEAVDAGGIARSFPAKSVILATGGFSANAEMVKRYITLAPGSSGTSSNPEGRHFDVADGDGLEMAKKAGAQLLDLAKIEIIPRQGGRLLDYVGGDIYVNSEGERFVSENSSYGALAEAVMRQPGQIFWVITDSQSVKGSVLQHKLLIGEVMKAGSVKEMARKMHVPERALEKTLERYNGFVDLREDKDFGKRIFTQRIDKPPFYFGREFLEPHYTVGGVRISPRAEALRPDGSPVRGLWAAGEVAGGVHGAARQGGVAFTDCLVFGRIAGTEAAKSALAR